MLLHQTIIRNSQFGVQGIRKDIDSHAIATPVARAFKPGHQWNEMNSATGHQIICCGFVYYTATRCSQSDCGPVFSLSELLELSGLTVFSDRRR